MTIRNPLVKISGKIVELPASDSIGGAAQGPVGMTFQNTWSALISYNQNDVVFYNGSSYIALQANTNQTPPAPFGSSTAYWAYIAWQGATGPTGPTGATGATGAAGSGLSLFSEIVTSSSQTTIDFTSIPGTAKDLIVTVQSRDTQTGSGNVAVLCQLNNDSTSSNYDGGQNLFGSVTSVTANAPAATSNGVSIYPHPQDSATSGVAAAARISLINYAGTTWFKSIFCESYCRDGTSQQINRRGFEWKSTSAITRVKFTAGGTAFKDGSVARCWLMG